MREVKRTAVKTKVRIDGPKLRDYAFNAQDILARITEKKPFATIFFLDCCRKYHLRNQNLITRAEKGTDNQSDSLRPMLAGAGSLIAFACARGALARDGEEGETNGSFTKCLLKHIKISNDDVRIMLADVTNEMVNNPKSEQVPHVTSALKHRHICLRDPVAGKEKFRSESLSAIKPVFPRKRLK